MLSAFNFENEKNEENGPSVEPTLTPMVVEENVEEKPIESNVSPMSIESNESSKSSKNLFDELRGRSTWTSNQSLENADDDESVEIPRFTPILYGLQVTNVPPSPHSFFNSLQNQETQFQMETPKGFNKRLTDRTSEGQNKRK